MKHACINTPLSRLTLVETQGEKRLVDTIQKTFNVSGVCQSRARDISWIFPSGFFRIDSGISISNS
ncbi:hypothetical protein F2P79_019590 [Pimephales promelas]|nr:hypothetical protein F2P79_019590 [Pimephales promelas]